MEVDFCPACRQVVSKEYLYCPQCGERLRSPLGVQDILNSPFERLEKTRGVRALDKLEESVSQLEQELTRFLENRALPKT